jgi:hypothetical protein
MDDQRNVVEESAPVAAARRDVAATRDRMSDTIAEIESRVSGTVASVKEKVDVVTMVKQNPWPALAAAFVAGVALSVTGADRRAARATADAAKRAPSTAKTGATKAAQAVTSGVSHLASATVEKIRGDSSDGATEAASTASRPGMVARVRSSMGMTAIGDVLRSGVEELPGVTAARAETGGNPT